MRPFAAMRLKKAASGGGGGGAGSHRYWRLNCTTRGPSGVYRIGELWLNTVAGVNIKPSGGTAIEFDHFGSDSVANVFDSNYSSEWVTLSDPSWIGYDYGAPVAIVEYALGTANGPNMPAAWTFDYSDDGATWTPADTRSGITWGIANTPIVFSF